MKSPNNNDCEEIILDIEDDSVVPELTKLAERLEKSSFSKELKSATLFPQRPKKFVTTDHDVKGLNFIRDTDGAGWLELENRFDDITRETSPIGFLPRSRFGECLGMNKDSNEFAEELLDALTRRLHMTKIDLIGKAQLREFWDQIGDQSFASRLQIFFDMVDKDGDGRISEDGVRKLIIMSASTNQLSHIQEQADEYAALIMEELDPENLGYIMIESLEILLMHHLTHTQSGRGESKNLSAMLSQKLRNVNDKKSYTRMHLAFPNSLYGGESLKRALRYNVNSVRILKVALYPGNVLAIHMSKPEGFKYKSGQYIFVNCSSVSTLEWHPFSISSAPGDDYLSVHIQALGDWTTQLRTLFSQVCRPPVAVSELGCPPSIPKIRIDGPYSAPSQDYIKYDVVLLIGLGIKATPMFSIIKDILNNIQAKQEENDFLETSRNSALYPASLMSKKNTSNNFKTARAYCYWVTKEQGSFDWFRGVMDEVVETDRNGVIEMHNYCTSVYEEDDARSAMITILQSLTYAKNGVDMVSGTRVKTHFVKPDWLSVYKRIALQHPHQRIGVFYGGTSNLAKELKELAFEFSHKTSTNFEFHKDSF